MLMYMLLTFSKGVPHDLMLGSNWWSSSAEFKQMFLQTSFDSRRNLCCMTVSVGQLCLNWLFLNLLSNNVNSKATPKPHSDAVMGHSTKVDNNNKKKQNEKKKKEVNFN